MGEILPSKNNSSRYCQKLSSSCVCLCPLLVNPTNSSCPALGSMRAREPGLQAPSNLAGSKIKNTHFSPLINSFSEISNIGKRTQYVSCTYSEGMAIKPMNSKLVAKYALLQAPSKHENRLAGFGGDSRTGQIRSPLIKAMVIQSNRGCNWFLPLTCDANPSLHL